MSKLQEVMAERILSGLRRRSIVRCSQWAEQYRVMGQPFPGPWSFNHHPWLRAFHDSDVQKNVVQKSAQMGFTESALNIVFYTLDIKGRDVLYVLPVEKPDASVFSASRFNPALELSPHLQKLFSDVNNVGHKRAGTRNLYIRGSRSRSGLKSLPAYLLVLDELDEMVQENIPLAEERMAGQTDYRAIFLSTPTVEGEGINKYFSESTQNHFFFRCPSHGGFTELKFPDSLKVTADDVNDPAISNSHLFCMQCQSPLPNETKMQWLSKGEWVSTFPGRDSIGWYINQFYSMAAKTNPVELAKASIRAKYDRSDEQEYFNSKGGLTHYVEGATISDEDIKNCVGTYTTSRPYTPSGRLVTMGVDQGYPWFNVEIDEWQISDLSNPGIDDSSRMRPRLLLETKIMQPEELDLFMKEFAVRFAVIDAHPERRKALEFANRFYGRVRLCFYAEGVNGKQINVSDSELNVSVDRTTWLDTSLGRFRSHSINLPQNVSNEYRQHIKALARVYDKDRFGNPIGRYVHGNKPDHFAHARNYSEIALHLAAKFSGARSLTSVW